MGRLGRVQSRRYRVSGVPYDALTMDETLAQLEEAIRSRSAPLQHTAVNAAKIVRARSDPFLLESIEASDIVNVDGQAVVWAARLLGNPAPERVAGIDLMWELLQRANAHGFRVYFLGATQQTLDAVLERVRRELPGVVVAGAHHGYFGDEGAEAVVEGIASSRADILLVAMPTPQKERFVHAYLDRLDVAVAMGVGGSFDVLAGVTRRAPRWLQRAGLEWAFRLAQEPRRLFKRYAVTNAKFVALVASDALRKRSRA